MSLPCWVKWAISLLVGPLGFAVGLALVLVLAACVVGLLYFLSKMLGKVLDEEQQQRAGNVLLGNPDATGFRQLGVITTGLIVFLVVFGLWVSGSAFMQSYFGCDTCLPEFMQKSCKVAKDATEAKDREDYTRICAAHPRWCAVDGGE